MENTKLGRLYQTFAAPTRAARAKAETNALLMTISQCRELTAPRPYHPKGVVTSAVRVASRHALELYALAVVTAATLVTTWAAVQHMPFRAPFAVGALCALALYAEAQTVRLTPVLEMSVGSVLFVMAAVLFGPLAAIAVAVSGLLVDLPRRDGEAPLLRWLIWTASRATVAGGAGLLAFSVGGVQPRDLGSLIAAVCAASAADVVGDLLLAPIPGVIRKRGSWVSLVRTLLPVQVSALPLHIPIISLLAYAYIHVSPWSVALFVVPAFAAHRLFMLYARQRETSSELAQAVDRLEHANLSFAAALVATLDARDKYTAGHSTAVAVYARDIARRMGLSEEDQARAHLAGLVHDIGKVGLSAGLLEKQGPLNLEERRQMEQHPVIGQRILANVENLVDIGDVVRHHHERVDGFGYPDGLSGDEIPLLSRIIAVADAYNAMTSDRPYREAMASHVARMRLARAVETQFDTAVVAAFEAILATASEDYRTGTRSDFALNGDAAAERVSLVSVA